LKCLGNQESAMEALKAIDQRLRNQHEAETRIELDETMERILGFFSICESSIHPAKE
jgi:hypothetical protein